MSLPSEVTTSWQLHTVIRCSWTVGPCQSGGPAIARRFFGRPAEYPGHIEGYGEKCWRRTSPKVRELGKICRGMEQKCREAAKNKVTSSGCL